MSDILRAKELLNEILKEQIERGGFADMYCCLNRIREITKHAPAALENKPEDQAEQIKILESEKQYLEECLAEKRKLTKEISDLLSPSGDGPESPSLCDLFGPVKKLMERIKELEDLLREIYPILYNNYNADDIGPGHIIDRIEQTLKEKEK